MSASASRASHGCARLPSGAQERHT